MKTHCYLSISSRGSVAARKNRQEAGRDEVVIGLNIELPNALFQRPALTASIAVAEKDAPTLDITGEVMDNIKDAIHAETGMTFKIDVEREPSDADPSH